MWRGLHFTVTDTGMGIPSDRQAKLFQAFSQGDNSLTRKYGGTGLGLVISQRLVALMKGRIWLESEVGVGSTFHFTVQIPTTSTASIEDEMASKSSERLFALAALRTRRWRVLVAEDQPVNQRLVARLLELRGHESVLANNGREALDHLAAGRFDVVLAGRADARNGWTDSHRLALRDRERGTGRHTPVIALTVHAMTGDRVVLPRRGVRRLPVKAGAKR